MIYASFNFNSLFELFLIIHIGFDLSEGLDFEFLGWLL